MDYSEFFLQITGHHPLKYQERFHKERSDLTLCDVPTGLGKTQAVLVDWLYRLHHDRANTPTRLVWCLPGRALTEQVYKVAAALCAACDTAVRVCRLMGGSDDNHETLAPDQPAVLVGVQDILVSRALNRGYARRPFRWPIDFALLTNDVYWVLDEVQLLGESVATTAQLAGFWQQFGTFGKTQACWLSATLREEWLKTVDFPNGASVFILSGPEWEDPVAAQRLQAPKALEPAPESCRTAAGVAALVADLHRPGTLSLVVVNTVDRAREIYTALKKKLPGTNPLLIHSRFRPAERRSKTEQLSAGLPEGGRIVVSTQAIEAGMDLDADLMLTDLAPYSSLVQRFGRVNRSGKKNGCRIFWVDRPAVGKRKNWAAPYEEDELEAAESVMRSLTSAAPADLPPVEGRAPWNHVLRRADLLDLFDTSPDLGGNHLDISRFVRSSEDRDVFVFWRKWERTAASVAPPDEEMRDVADAELCPAPIGDIDSKKRSYWIWETLSGRWNRVQQKSQIYPGCTLLAHAEDGGYLVNEGWSPESRDAVKEAEVEAKAGTEKLEPEADDRGSFKKYKQTLRAHEDRVCEKMDALLNACERLGLAPYLEDLRVAARKHDWGKAHPVMQETLQTGKDEELLAKSLQGGRHKQPYFRHELASALAMLDAGDSDLAAYLVAAHHGRIRLHVRSIPGERDNGDVLVRGIKEEDHLKECDLGAGCHLPETPLRLDVVSLGCGAAGPSWTERSLRLRESLGPFRLAYLEVLLRAADEQASEDHGPEVQA